MPHLTRHDYAAVLALLGRLEPLAGDRGRLADAALAGVAELVAAATAAWVALDRADGAPAVAAQDGFVLSMPLALDGRRLVRIELHRRHHDFSERERARLALLQPHLAWLYRESCGAPPESRVPATPVLPIAARGSEAMLTPREGDVMRWLACGKTDADIAALLAISPRTVHKHLLHIYEKLGVETRTAAVMALGRRTARADAWSAQRNFGAAERDHHAG